jgi:alpha-ketoglutarate-dependent taurine dioxygenase
MEIKKIRRAAVEVSGIDLKTATESELLALTNIVANEGIVIIKDQKMNIDKFNEINLAWGQMHKSGNPACHPDYPYIFRVTNATLEKGQKGMFSQGFLDWHANSVVCADPEEVVCLYGEQPLGGTPTTYSNVTKMYEDLPDNIKTALIDSWATFSNTHKQYASFAGNAANNKDYGVYKGEDIDLTGAAYMDLYNFRTRTGRRNGPKEYSDYMEVEKYPNGRRRISIRKRLLRKHPITEKPTLFFPFPMMTDPTISKDLIEDLTERCTTDERYLYESDWSEGDICVMDQTSTIHKRNAVLETHNGIRMLYRTSFYYKDSKWNSCYE